MNLDFPDITNEYGSFSQFYQSVPDELSRSRRTVFYDGLEEGK